ENFRGITESAGDDDRPFSRLGNPEVGGVNHASCDHVTVFLRLFSQSAELHRFEEGLHVFKHEHRGPYAAYHAKILLPQGPFLTADPVLVEERVPLTRDSADDQVGLRYYRLGVAEPVFDLPADRPDTEISDVGFDCVGTAVDGKQASHSGFDESLGE